HSHERAAAPRQFPVARHATLQAFTPVLDTRPGSLEAWNVFTGKAQVSAEGRDHRSHDSRSGRTKKSHSCNSSATRARGEPRRGCLPRSGFWAIDPGIQNTSA